MRILDELAIDARSAMRVLRAQGGLVATAVLILAIGLGATSAVGRMMRGLLLDPLPGVEHQALWALRRNTLSYPDFVDLRAAAKDVAEVAAYVNVGMGLASKDGERLVRGALVSDNYFDLLGIKPIRGRYFEANDAIRPVAVIADSLWRGQLLGDPEAIGSSIRLGEETFTVIGVAPPGFAGLDLEYRTAVWVPLALQPRVLPAQARFDLLNRRRTRWLGGIAQLAEGVTPARAQEWIDSWTVRMSEAFPRGRAGWSIRLVPLAEAAISSGPRMAIIDLLRLIAIVTGLMLLITCANLSILLLLGLVSRSGELAVRLAHGASRARIARQLLLEILGLAVAGAAAGLVLGGWLAQIGQRLVLPPQIAPKSLSLDGWTFAVTLAAAFLSCLIASLPPLWRIRSVELSQLLRRASVGVPGLGVTGPHRDLAVASRRSALAMLVIGQTALSLPLLYGVLLVGGSLIAQMRIDPGFTVDGVVLATVDPGVTGLGRAEGLALYQRLREALETAPDVERAGLAALAPIGDNRLVWDVFPPGSEEPLTVAGNVVSPGYFASLGIAMLRGRDFDFEIDGAQREPVVVINASLARRLWPGEDAIGRKLETAGFDGPEPNRVIGLVADSRQGALQVPPEPFLYRPLTQDYLPHTTLHVRTSMPLAALRDLVRESVQRLDPRVPVADIRTLASDVDAALARPRYLALGMGLLGTVAAALAAVGLYGVLSFAAQRRAREIGIRMSLGARPKTIHAEVLARGLRLALVGMIPGIALAVAFGRLLASRLYGLSAFEGLSLAGAALLLVAVALLASERPARWLSAVDPAEILRLP